MADLIQIELFEPAKTPQKQIRRDVDKEAKLLLQSVGADKWSQELKTLVAAKLMREIMPDGGKLMLQAMATTAIIETAKQRG